MKRVVVTGMGVVAPNGLGLEAFRQALKKGKSGIESVALMKEKNFGCQVGGVCKGYDEAVAQHFSEAELFAMSQGMKLGSLAAIEAFTHAQLSIPSTDSDFVYEDTGAVIGTGIGGLDVFADKVYPSVEAGKTRRMGSSIVEQTMCSGVSAKIAGYLGLGNQVTTNSSACSTGTEAIIMGVQRIKHGLAKRMLVGGVEAAHIHIWAGFDAMRVLSRKFNDSPTLASRPLSATACGFVPGSGAGVLVLEELETALERGVPILAEVLGTHTNCGGMRHGGSMTAPSPVGVQRCIRSALLDAQIEPQDLDYINGHLTATMADPVELKNWQEALELKSHEFPLVNATKSMIGHALGAAGAIETIATLMQLTENFVHKSLNCHDLHPEIEHLAESIPQETVSKSLNIAAKASFGFGDVNSCLIFKAWS